ncbi:MAG TPA: ATP-grasp domain-containing protein [Planctomycetaceae bacterium]|jgi:predicted ATP-grasp superfamily ATP-dependent carboligase|nr:ATP-grasp domain-containing protein [Planctomycetaceae bacterium]
MPVFVHEFFCSGAFDGDLGDSSLAREGLAMLAAVVDDFSQVGDDTSVVTTLDRRLRGSPIAARIAEQAQVTWVESPTEERSLFQEFAAASQATLVIAPETGGWLLQRRQITDAAGGRFLGPSSDAIRLCGDKLRFCEHLKANAIPTIPTTRCDFFANFAEYPFPIVVKPRDGAGSVNTFLLRDARELEERRDELIARFAEAGSEPIVQPFVEGRPLSAAALIDAQGDRVDIFPLGEQRISRDGRFRYVGGRIPAPGISPQVIEDATELVADACRSLPGLAGFVGFDLIASAGETRVRILEANPRLTTSYVGYRRLTHENLAARMLCADAAREPIEWHVPVGWAKLAKRAQAHHSHLAESLGVPRTGGPAAGGPALAHPTKSALPTSIAWVEFDADGNVRVG